MKIENNVLFLNNQKEFSQKLLKYFFKRLKLFLLIEHSTIEPSVRMTSNKKILNSYSLGEEGYNSSAFYDEPTGTVVFNAECFRVSESHVAYKDSYFNIEEFRNYKYAIPLSYIYHELIHHIQYTFSSYEDEYNDILEGSADIYTFIITGQESFDYMKEAIAIWYLARKILNLDLIGFYSFVVNVLQNENFVSAYMLSEKRFLKTLAINYNANVKKFLRGFKNDFSGRASREELMRDLNELHSLIFYKY